MRALRLSSQPPKAGVPFPGALATRLAEATTASLQPTDGPDRWSAVLEAVAFSPVRTLVVPAAAPEARSDELLATVKRLGPLLPQIAALFGIEVAPERPDAEAVAADDPSRRPEEAGGQARSNARAGDAVRPSQPPRTHRPRRRQPRPRTHPSPPRTRPSRTRPPRPRRRPPRPQETTTAPEEAPVAAAEPPVVEAEDAPPAESAGGDGPADETTVTADEPEQPPGA